MQDVYIDESKKGRYLLVAVPVTDPAPLRRAVAELVLPGQRRLHMVKENDSRRRQILSIMANVGVTATVYDAGRRYPTEAAAREACLRAAVEDHGAAPTRLVIEQDDSLVRTDETLLYKLSRRVVTLRYDHRRAADEPLLAVPDAIAWAWAKGGGGGWRPRVAPLVRTARQV